MFKNNYIFINLDINIAINKSIVYAKISKWLITQKKQLQNFLKKQHSDIANSFIKRLIKQDIKQLPQFKPLPAKKSKNKCFCVLLKTAQKHDT